MHRNCPQPEAGLSSGPLSGVALAPLFSGRAPHLLACQACGSCHPHLSPGGFPSCLQDTVVPLTPPCLHPRLQPGCLATCSQVAGHQRAPLRLAALLHPQAPPSKPAPHRGLGSVGQPWGPGQAAPSLLGTEFSCWWYLGLWPGPTSGDTVQAAQQGGVPGDGWAGTSRCRVLIGTEPRDVPGRAP